MSQLNANQRNFLFFLNTVHPLTVNDLLISALASPKSWDEAAGILKEARQRDPFVRSIKKANLAVHVPFCDRICAFCCCPRVLLQKRLDIDSYIGNLTRQMLIFSSVYKDMDTRVISFEGGSPSILDEKQLTAILDAVDKAFPAQNRRIFFSAKPSSWTASKSSVLVGRGLFYLSVGVQSFDEKVLRRVGRPQTRRKVLWCLRSARKAGVPEINVDLIAGLPGQTIEGFLKGLKIVIEEGVDIVSVKAYSGFPLKNLRGPGETIPEFFKRRHDMMKTAAQVLKEAGFSRKEGIWSAYRRNNGEGENYKEEVYERFESALASFGPSCVGHFPGAILYRAGPVSSGDNYSSACIALENPDYNGYMMACYAMISMINGLDERVFFGRFGVSCDRACGEALRYLQHCGLVSYSKGIWKFCGEWTIHRLNEYFALSRVLLGQDVMSRLSLRFYKMYDPRRNYSRLNSLLKAYSNNFLMSVYYQMGC